MASRMGLSALSPSPIGLCRHKIAGANATQRGTMRVSAALLRCSSRSRGSKRMLHSRSPAGLDGRGATTKSSSSRRRKASKALGAVATVAAATVLAREALLPDSFAEWDDQVKRAMETAAGSERASLRWNAVGGHSSFHHWQADIRICGAISQT